MEIGIIYKQKFRDMKNRITILGLLLMLVSFQPMFAQDHKKPSKEQIEKRKAKMKAMKRAFIGIEIELTPEEEKAFWPIYDKYEAKREALRNEHKELRKLYKGKEPEEMTEAEAKDILAKEASFRERRLEIDKGFDNELKSVLSAKKILMLHKAEMKFKKQLLDRMKGRRGPGGHGGPRGEFGPPPHMMED
jgi:hypothetical protein